MGSRGYNPDSADASFAKLFTRLDTQDQMLKEIRERQEVFAQKAAHFDREKWINRGGSTAGALAAFHHVIIQIFGR